jgi:hypothetical protein
VVAVAAKWRCKLFQFQVLWLRVWLLCVCVCVCVWLFVHEGHLINGRNADLYVHCCQDSWLSAGGFAIAI